MSVLSLVMLAHSQPRRRALHTICSCWISLVLDLHMAKRVNLPHEGFQKTPCSLQYSLNLLCAPGPKTLLNDSLLKLGERLHAIKGSDKPYLQSKL